MQVIVAGSRDCHDPELLQKAIRDTGWEITSIVHGGARGADTLADQYADNNNIPKLVFQADWNKNGKAAGPIRNSEMIDYVKQTSGSGVILLWDGKSRGTWDVLKKSYAAGLKVWVQMWRKDS